MIEHLKKPLNQSCSLGRQWLPEGTGFDSINGISSCLRITTWARYLTTKLGRLNRWEIRISGAQSSSFLRELDHLCNWRGWKLPLWWFEYLWDLCFIEIHRLYIIYPNNWKAVIYKRWHLVSVENTLQRDINMILYFREFGSLPVFNFIHSGTVDVQAEWGSTRRWSWSVSCRAKPSWKPRLLMPENTKVFDERSDVVSMNATERPF